MTEHSEQGVMDAIDALIDEQLAEGEPFAGYDFGDPGFPRCRCGDMWHGLPTHGCPGSDSEGPMQDSSFAADDWHAMVESNERNLLLAIEAGLGRGASPQMTIVDEMRPLNDVPSHPSEQRVQVPRPTTTPPMWAVDPTRSRRRRTHQ